jgi:hypothetical protein
LYLGACQKIQEEKNQYQQSMRKRIALSQLKKKKPGAKRSTEEMLEIAAGLLQKSLEKDDEYAVEI